MHQGSKGPAGFSSKVSAWLGPRPIYRALQGRKEGTVSRRVHAGCTQGARRVHPGFTQGSPRVHAGFTQGSRRVHAGCTQGAPPRVQHGWSRVLSTERCGWQARKVRCHARRVHHSWSNPTKATLMQSDTSCVHTRNPHLACGHKDIDRGEKGTLPHML